MNIKVRVKQADEIDGKQRVPGECLFLSHAEAYKLADAGKVEILRTSAREQAQAAAEKAQNEKDQKARAEAEKEAARQTAAEKAAADKAEKAEKASGKQAAKAE